MLLGTEIFRRLVVGLFVFTEDTSPCLLLPHDPYGHVAVRKRGRSSRSNIIDLGCCPFTIIFDLDCGKEVTPIFMGQGTIVLVIILQLILHGQGESVLDCNSNLIHRYFLIANFPISSLTTIYLNRRGGRGVGTLLSRASP